MAKLEEILNSMIEASNKQAGQINKLKDLILRQQEMLDQLIKTQMSINKRVLKLEGSPSKLISIDGSPIRSH